MASSIRECYDVCQDTGGFVTNIRCTSSIRAVLHRAGNDDESYTIEMQPLISSGDEFSFALPIELFSFPYGYYDVDIFDGQLFKRTIRFNLHTSGLAGRTTIINSECVGQRDVEPNVSIPVECYDECDYIRPEICQVPFCADRTDLHDIRLGTTFKRIKTVDDEEIQRRRIFANQLKAKLATSNAVVFYTAEQSQSIADYFNEQFENGSMFQE